MYFHLFNDKPHYLYIQSDFSFVHSFVCVYEYIRCGLNLVFLFTHTVSTFVYRYPNYKLHNFLHFTYALLIINMALNLT